MAALESLYQRELTDDIPLDVAAQTQFDAYEQQKRGLERQEDELRAEMRAVQAKITEFQEDMNAEELGQKLRGNSSGLQGIGPRYQFARKQRDLYQQRREELQSQIKTLGALRDQLTANQRNLGAEALARRNQDRTSSQDKRGELLNRIENARKQLSTLEATRSAQIEEFRRVAFDSAEFQKLKDDPLSRMTAYAELKADPRHGQTISLFSLLTVMFVIFLEVVPVLAKIFFSPLAAYGQLVRTNVELKIQDASHRARMDDKEKRGAEADKDLDVIIKEKAAGMSPPLEERSA